MEDNHENTKQSTVGGSSKYAVQNYAQQLNSQAIAECILYQVFSRSLTAISIIRKDLLWHSPTPSFLPQNFLCRVFFFFVHVLAGLFGLVFLYKTSESSFCFFGFGFFLVKCQCNIKFFAFIWSSESEVRVCLLFFCLQGFQC